VVALAQSDEDELVDVNQRDMIWEVMKSLGAQERKDELIYGYLVDAARVFLNLLDAARFFTSYQMQLGFFSGRFYCYYRRLCIVFLSYFVIGGIFVAWVQSFWQGKSKVC